MMELKQLCKKYDRRVSLMYIPFYHKRIKHIKELISDIQLKPANQSEKNDKADLDFLDKQLKSLQKELKNEKKQLQDAAENIYNEKWKNIKKIGKKRISAFDLKVYQGPPGGETCDVLFNLVHNTAKSDEKQARKDLFSNMTARCKLYADGELVKIAETKRKNLQWPDFVVEFNEQF